MIGALQNNFYRPSGATRNLQGFPAFSNLFSEPQLSLHDIFLTTPQSLGRRYQSLLNAHDLRIFGLRCTDAALKVRLEDRKHQLRTV
jgi:hypothetical protein